ncbi:MAG: hypothetical protein AB7G11_02725 [Phycisphaerales bacterium]
MNQSETILVAENTRLALAGLDSDEREMKTTQRERSPALSAKLGGGPPLLPHSQASRRIRLFRVVRKEKLPTGGFVLTIGHPGFTATNGKSIPALHAQGGRRYPKRDVTRIGPTARKKIQDAAAAFYRKELRYSATAVRVVSRVFGR